MAVEIYLLSCPETGAPMYVGKANDSGQRLARHHIDARRRNTPLYAWMRTLGKSPVLTVLEFTTEEAWPSREVFWIGEYRALGPMLNLAKGGKAPSQTKEQRARGGQKVARMTHDDPVRRALWRLKKDAGDNLRWAKRHGMPWYERRRAFMRSMGFARPDLFACWQAL
jgi:hypothetical protein